MKQLDDCEHKYMCKKCHRDYEEPQDVSAPSFEGLDPDKYLPTEVMHDMEFDKIMVNKGPLSVQITFTDIEVELLVLDNSDTDFAVSLNYITEPYADCLDPDNRRYYPPRADQLDFDDQWAPELEMDETPEPPLPDGDHEPPC